MRVNGGHNTIDNKVLSILYGVTKSLFMITYSTIKKKKLLI